MSGKREDSNSIDAQERRIKALELRKAGLSYRAIAGALKSQGIEISPAQAQRDVVKALEGLASVEKDKAAELRQLELERLNDIYRSLHSMINAKNLGAIDRAHKNIEIRSKLLGLILPAEVNHTGSIGLRWEDVMKASPDDNAPNDQNPFA